MERGNPLILFAKKEKIMRTKNQLFTRTAWLLIVLLIGSTLRLTAQPYPTSSYQLSADGKTLVAWTGPEKNIDMTADPAFNAVEVLGKQAFYANLQVLTLVLPNSLKTIEDGAFFQTENIQQISMPNSVTSIGKLAFMGCYELSTINIPTSLQILDTGAFYGCK